jgi:SOS response regulatory protein OraA/RecX
MPRGRKKAPDSIEGQIAELEAKIENHKSAIEQAKSKIKDLQLLKEQADISEIQKALQTKGLSVQQAVEILNAHTTE